MTSLFRYNVRAHARLDGLFLEHQTALFDRDPALAAKTFATYRKALFEHMRQEESVLLPFYKQHGEAPDAPTVFFTGEHKRMREFLRRIQSRLRRLDRRSPKARWVALFDLEAAYKNLVQHHDRREKSKLYPALDRFGSRGERLKLLARQK